jgi:two-component system cell cycle sensor histidine kinase/response regulator CckA
MRSSVLRSPHHKRFDKRSLIYEELDDSPESLITGTLGSLLPVLEGVPEAIVLTGSDGEIVYANSPLRRLFGYECFDLPGRPCTTLIGAGFQDVFVEAHDRYLANARLGPLDTNVDLRGRRKEGEEFPLQIRFGRFQQKLKEMSLLCFHNVTEREDLKAELSQAQKMEVVGMLTGGVAHDFNNLLTVINGYGEMLAKDFRGNARPCLMAQGITEAGRRGASLVRQLMAFSGQHVVERRVLDLNAVIEDTQRLLYRLIGEDIALATVLEPALGRVKADPGQVEQVILNLAVNARDAMPNGGKVTVETANARLDDNDVKTRAGVRPGPYVMLAMTDTGCGMDEETKARIFEPFFTTKEVGKGTGLGLATIDRIVKENGGHVTVQSEVGRGATFQVFLPRAEEPLPDMEPHAVCQQASRQGGETVLVVEDDDSVREVMSRVLQQHGYTVLAARDPRQARELFEHNGLIQLLMADVILPEMTGVELSHLLMSQKPGLRVLYVSGYPDRRGFQTEADAKATPVLLKPFSPTTLLQRTREVLDGRTPDRLAPDR